jgi:hypothetical protein
VSVALPLDIGMFTTSGIPDAGFATAMVAAAIVGTVTTGNDCEAVPGAASVLPPPHALKNALPKSKAKQPTIERITVRTAAS